MFQGRLFGMKLYIFSSFLLLFMSQLRRVKGFRQGCQVYVTKPAQLLLTTCQITAQTSPITFRLSKLFQRGSKPPSEGFYLGRASSGGQAVSLQPAD